MSTPQRQVVVSGAERTGGACALSGHRWSLWIRSPGCPKCLHLTLPHGRPTPRPRRVNGRVSPPQSESAHTVGHGAQKHRFVRWSNQRKRRHTHHGATEPTPNQTNAKVSTSSDVEPKKSGRHGATKLAPNPANVKVATSSDVEPKKSGRHGATELAPNRANVKVSTSSDVEPKKTGRHGATELAPNRANVKVSTSSDVEPKKMLNQRNSAELIVSVIEDRLNFAEVVEEHAGSARDCR